MKEGGFGFRGRFGLRGLGLGVLGFWDEGDSGK